MRHRWASSNSCCCSGAASFSGAGPGGGASLPAQEAPARHHRPRWSASSRSLSVTRRLWRGSEALRDPSQRRCRPTASAWAVCTRRDLLFFRSVSASNRNRRRLPCPSAGPGVSRASRSRSWRVSEEMTSLRLSGSSLRTLCPQWSTSSSSSSRRSSKGGSPSRPGPAAKAFMMSTTSVWCSTRRLYRYTSSSSELAASLLLTGPQGSGAGSLRASHSD
mmetsp:Transcript_1494/g.2062  ORF Transcript_1494/g.2062 Transcript_1494/m.2062 type:complete len:219 (-) Transcript_1494:832-1488(-)